MVVPKALRAAYIACLYLLLSYLVVSGAGACALIKNCGIHRSYLPVITLISTQVR